MTKKKATPVSEAVASREIGLSEVKNKLLDSIARLRTASNFDKISEKQLKDFWQKEYPTAPFEELFTLKQIAEIDVETFFKKRSVIPSKILGIVSAIDEAVGKEKIPSSKLLKDTPAKTSALSKKVKNYELQYEMLINKCNMIIETLKLAESSPGFEKSKAVSSLAADIKKIDKILSSQHEKISKLL